MEKSNQSMCMSNQRQLALGIAAFVQDSDEMLPTPLEWVAATGLSSDPKVFKYPSTPHRGTPAQPDYGYNARLCDTSGITGEAITRLPIGDIENPEQVAVTCDAGKSLAAGPLSGAYALFSIADDADRRHSKGFIISFLDGHVSYFPNPEAMIGLSLDRYALPANASGFIDLSKFSTSAEANAALAAAGITTHGSPVVGTLSGGVFTVNDAIQSSVSINNGIYLQIDCMSAVQITAPYWWNVMYNTTDPKDNYNVHQNWVKILPAENEVGFGLHSLTFSGPGTVNTNIDPRFLGQEVYFPGASKYRITLKLGPIIENASTLVKSDTGGTYHAQNDGTESKSVYARGFECTVKNLLTGDQVSYNRPLALGSIKSNQGWGMKDAATPAPNLNRFASGGPIKISRIVWSQ